MGTENTSIGILGAGISGLTTAYSLQQKGADVTVYEKNEYPGGVMQTHQQDSWLVEKGPNTLLIREQRIWDMVANLNLNNRLVKPGPEAQKRYIIRNGQLCAAPMSLVDFIKTDLLSASSKWRLLKEPFIAGNADERESVAGFIRRRLGREVLDYAVNPFVSGIYAGDPKQLSMQHTFSSLYELEKNYGSLTKGFFKCEKKTTKAERALVSFDNGLQVLPKALAAELGIALQLNTEIHRISRSATGWTLKAGTETQHHDVVVSTIPAYQLENIWSDEKTQQSVSQLAKITYAPMSVLALGFERDQVGHPLDGFGVLIPEKENYSFLGCLFSSTLFPNRAPENKVLLTCFMGGACQPSKASGSTEILLNRLIPELQELLNIQGQPVFHHHAYWKRAIPQYTLGFDQYLQSMDQIESANPGFFLGGNYRHGISVPDCIINGMEMAERVSKIV